MPALKPTAFTGRITWLGRVRDRDATLAATAQETLLATFAGVAGEDHGGLTRPSCSRLVDTYPKGTEIRNVRQFSVLSDEDLQATASAMGIAALDPAWLGASMVIAGIPDFTLLPPSSRLQGESGATLVVDMENRPCQLPAKVIEAALPGKGRAFKPAAVHRRGVTAWVEREGVFRIGDQIRLFVPDQPIWPHLEAARG